MSSQEAKYHIKCLAELYNNRRAYECRMRLDTHATGNESEFIHGIVFAELVSYIEENIADKSIAPIFKLAHLVKLYGDRLTQLGLDMSVQRLHSPPPD